MNEKQECLLDLLIEFDQICRNQKIEYSLAGGSMLGAIRHKGFIPWDDDIDVFVTKKNFDKLRKYFDENKPENREFVHRWNNDRYPMIIARYYSTDNTSLQRATAWDYMPAGQYIDIMIMIPMPDGDSEQDKYLEEAGLYIELNNEYYADNIFRDGRFLRRYRFWSLMKKLFGKDYVMNHFEKKLFGYDDDTCEYYMISHCVGSVLKYPRSVVRDTVYVDFESTKVPVCKNYMELFWYGYGPGWRQMPPLDARARHILFDDFNRPYRFYMDDYMRFVDKDEAFRKAKSSKDHVLEEGRIRNELYSGITGTRCRLFAIDFLKRIEEADLDPNEALKRGEFDKIFNLFLPYNEMQFSTGTKKWDGFVDIGDDLLYVFCCVLTYYTGDYLNAGKLLRMRDDKTGRPENKKLEELKKTIEAVEELYRALDFEGEDAVRERIESFEDRDVQVDFCLAEMKLLESSANDEEGIDRLLETAERRILQFPYCWDFMGYLGRALEKKGEREKAETAFRMMEEMSSNGELVRDMKAAEKAGHEN
ncbi:MAG: LicD family protein [Bacillota bacterium]